MATMRKDHSNGKDDLNSGQRTKDKKDSPAHKAKPPLHKNEPCGILEENENACNSGILLSFWARV